MRSSRGPLLVGNLLLAAAIALTYGPRWGGRWGDEIAYALLALGSLAILPLWRRRRFTTLVLASAGAWSVVTGILLVYVTWRLPQGRWMTWWHAVTSFAFLLAFLAHWARNQPRLAGLARRLAERRTPTALLAAAWLALAGTLLAPLASRGSFGEQDYVRWADVSLGGALVLLLAGALVGRLRGPPFVRTDSRNRARGAVDASLLLAMWIATLTGFLLQYAARSLRAGDAYWLATAWHVVVSALLLALVLAHASFNVRPLASHVRPARPRRGS